VNGAWSPRSAGSTIKPFTYLLALEHGATPASVAADVPAFFDTPTGSYHPENYTRRCSGPVRYRDALANSLNIPAVRVLAAFGGPSVLHARLTDLGFTSLTKPVAEYGLGLTIGNAEVRLLELTNAYACLARLGNAKPYRLLASQPTGERALCDPRAAWLIADMLGDNAARTPSFGANSPLRFDFPVACKTGTSTDYRDNWAMGYTPEFTVGVWAGNFDGSAMRGVSGVSGAAPILHAIFEHLHERFGTSWYATPPGIVERDVHPLTGKLLTAPRSDGVREKFLAEHLPPVESPADCDGAGRVKLGDEYAAWFASAENSLADRAVLVESGHLRIVAPAPGTTFIIDPDLPSSRRVRLVAAGSAEAQWQSDSLRCEGGMALLAEGEHHLRVVDPTTGAHAETWIRVKTL
jgi:penicillin-binding protein 1C